MSFKPSFLLFPLSSGVTSLNQRKEYEKGTIRVNVNFVALLRAEETP
jgi:hypothetical protein